MFIKKITQLAFIIFTLFLSSCSNDKSLKIGLTTTLEDSGALSLLIEAFTQKHAIAIKPVIAGSGHIHQLIERGDIDSAITHDPEGEKKLLDKGLIESRKPFIKNDFLIVGPADDPAHIKLSLTPDEAFEKIAHTRALYISRGDNSGTHQMEKYWLAKSKNTNQALRSISTGAGMGATLAVAAEKSAYTLVDRGTWVNFRNKASLTPLFEETELLPNVYSVLSLSQKHADKQDAIALWENWLTSNEAKQLLNNYRINNELVFFN